MGINQKAKKLSSLSRVAAKSISGSDKRAWFLIEDGRETFFYIDKRISAPAKFKDPVRCKKILEKLKVTDLGGVDKKSPLLSGLVSRGGAGYQVSVSFKKNGAGKSTLAKALKDPSVKKILPDAMIVKAIEMEPESEQALEDARLDNLVDGEAEAESVEAKRLKAFKIFMWWKSEGKARYETILVRHSSADEDFLQTAKRRLAKFRKAKMYDLFESRFFGMASGPLERFRKEDFDMTKEQVKGYYQLISGILDDIQNEDNDEVSDGEIDQMVAESDISIVEQMEALEGYAVQLLLGPEDTIDFLDEAQGFDGLVRDLLNQFTPKDIIRMRDFFGRGNWTTFLTFVSLAGINNLKSASNMSLGVKRLIARLEKYKEIPPGQLLTLADKNNWKWELTKPEVKQQIKEARERKKNDKHLMTVFESRDLRPDLQNVPFAPPIDTAVELKVKILLQAHTPEELEYGVDNPYILQLIVEAGDYSKLKSNVVAGYAQICNEHGYDPSEAESEQQRKLELITSNLEELIAAEQDAAAQRASDAAAEEFGRAADVRSENRNERIRLAISAVQIGIGVFATAAAATATCGAGILAGHGVVTGLVSLAYDCRNMKRDYEALVLSLDSEVAAIKRIVDTVGVSAGQVSNRIISTVFGDLSNPWNRAEKLAKKAKLRLSEMKAKQGEMSRDIGDLLNISNQFGPKLRTLRAAIEALPEHGAYLTSLRNECTALEEHFEKHSSTVAAAISHCATMGGYIDGCEKRFTKICDNLHEYDPNMTVKTFLAVYGVLEFAGGIIAGGAAEGPTIPEGLDPIGDHGWVTAANFIGYLNDLDDARTNILDVRNVINEYRSEEE